MEYKSQQRIRKRSVYQKLLAEMIKLKCGNVTRLFLCVYLELMNVPIDNLELKPFRKSLMCCREYARMYTCPFVHLCCKEYTICKNIHLSISRTLNLIRNIYKIGNREIQRQIELKYNQFKNSKKTIEQFFKCRVIKAMKRDSSQFIIKTKKIDTKTLIIFGDSKNPDEYYFGKDYLNLKSFEPIAIEMNTLMKFYGRTAINDLEVDYYEQKINIYQLKSTKDGNGQMKTAGYQTRSVPGNMGGEINIGVHQWPSTDVFWLPTNLITNSFICTKSEKCYYTTNRKPNLIRHEKTCKDTQTVEGRQEEYGSGNDEVGKLSEILNIDYSQFRQQHLCCYDIETFSNGGILIPVSIAVASTLDGPRYFEKSNDTPEATYQMVKEFLEYLVELQQKLLHNLAPEIEHAIEFLQSEKDELFKSKRKSENYKSKAEFRKIYNYFKNYEALKIFGFNSRYVSYCMYNCTLCPGWTFVQTVQIVHFKNFCF